MKKISKYNYYMKKKSIRRRTKRRSFKRKKRTKKRYQKGGVKKKKTQQLTVGPSSTPQTLYWGDTPELFYPKKMKDIKSKKRSKKLKKEMKKIKKKQAKVLYDLKSSEKKIEKTGIPLEKNRSKNPDLLRTNEENRILAELDSPWGF